MPEAEVSKNRYWLLFVFVPAFLGLVYIYFNYDPSNHLFPSCPSKKYLGITCPGCGSQRAFHQLLHGHVLGAFYFNPLFLLAIPYVILGYVFQIKKVQRKYPALRKMLFGKTAIITVFVMVAVYGVCRNIFGF